MVGEIRDPETARIAVQAALTGHLVISTVHTNSALAAVSRLLDLGVEDYLLADVLRGVVGQRLVRRLCPHCRARRSRAQPTGAPARDPSRPRGLDQAASRTGASRSAAPCGRTGTWAASASTRSRRSKAAWPRHPPPRRRDRNCLEVVRADRIPDHVRGRRAQGRRRADLDERDLPRHRRGRPGDRRHRSFG